MRGLRGPPVSLPPLPPGVSDLRGRRFGWLTVETLISKGEVSPTGKRRGARWLCRCSCCGREVSVLRTNLRAGGTTSCGRRRAMLSAGRGYLKKGGAR